MNLRHSAFRLASWVFPNRETLVRAAKKVAKRTGVVEPVKSVLRKLIREQLEQLYPDLVQRVKGDVGIDATRQHMDDLLGLMEHRMDRLYRELAKNDPDLSYEGPVVEKRN